MKTKKKFKLPFQFFWKKDKPKNSAQVLINGKLVVFIICSIVSALINLIFISSLSVTPYSIGALFSIPAAILLGVLSIALDCSKLFHAIQVNTLNELSRKLQKFTWVSKIKRVAKKWTAIYVLYVMLSILTSVSLSSISIGTALSKNASTTTLISKDITKLEKAIGQTEGYEDKAVEGQVLSITSTDLAIQSANEKYNIAWPKILEYRQDRADFEALYGNSFSLTEEVSFKGETIIPDTYWDRRNSQIQSDVRAAGINLSIAQIRTISDTDFRQRIKIAEQEFYSNDTVESSQSASELYSKRARELVDGLFEKYKYPGTDEFVIFSETPSRALSQLEDLKIMYDSDNGDMGASSKIFLIAGTWVDTKTAKATGKTSSAEILMMLTLLFLSLLCELAINQFSPKTNISRKMLGQFSQYFPADFDVNDFMIDIIIEQHDYGELNDKQFEEQMKEAVLALENNRQTYIEKYSSKKEEFSSKVDEKVKEIEEMLK